MIQTGPEIHSNGADLNLYADKTLGIRKKYGNLHDHVIAAVAVGLWIFDIILYRDHLYIILAHQHLCHFVNIIHKRADNPYSRHVIQVFNHRFQRYLQSPALQLFHNTQRLFHTRLDHLNGVSLVLYRKLVI